MDEYNKINWREKLFQDDNIFINEEVMAKSYMHQSLNSTLNVADIQKELDRWDKRCKTSSDYPGWKFYMYQKCDTSQFNKVEHLRLINALKVLQSGRVKLNKFELSDRELLNNSAPMIQQENARFLKWAEMNWQPIFNKPIKMNNKLNKYAVNEWRQKCLSIMKLARYYVPVDLLPWCFTTGDISVEMVHIGNILDLGCVSKYMPPVLEEPYILDSKLLPLNVEKYYSKLPISCDKNVEEFIQSGAADVAVSLSSLKKIFSYIDTNQLWTLPVVIKTIRKNNHKKKVIFFDKPLCKQIVNKVDLNMRCHKLLLRSNFCQLEGFRYPTQDKIFNGKDQDSSKQVTKERINHNVAYKLWTLKQEDIENSVMHKNRTNKTFKVLVRNKIDACTPCEYGLQGVTVVPKLEYQLKFGGAAFSAKEVMSHWTDLTFRPNSRVQRVRIHYLTSEVIKVESANLASVSREATHLGMKPQSAFVVFYKLMLGLENHGDGYYLLRHNPKDGNFVSLLKSTNDAKAINVFDLHQDYSANSKLVEYNQPWTPIDTNVLLPAYEHNGHCPGLYKPCDVKANNSKGKFIYKPGKKKNKMKKNVYNKTRNV